MVNKTKYSLGYKKIKNINKSRSIRLKYLRLLSVLLLCADSLNIKLTVKTINSIIKSLTSLNLKKNSNPLYVAITNITDLLNRGIGAEETLLLKCLVLNIYRILLNGVGFDNKNFFLKIKGGFGLCLKLMLGKIETEFTGMVNLNKKKRIITTCLV